MPRVTIGLPVYNGEPFIGPAIQSILDQTFADFQLIIADNVSTDDTPGICRDFEQRDSRVRFIVNKKNIGGWRNHNKVLGLADTELFMWAGHDDLRSNGCLARCVELLDENPEAIMSFVGVKEIDSDGNDKPAKYVMRDFSVPSPSERFSYAIQLDLNLEIFYGLTRTPVMKSTGGCGQYPDSDRVLAARLALAGPFALTDEVMFYRRDHAGRSIKKYSNRHTRDKWINPGRHTGPGLPYHRELWEFAKAVMASKVPASEKRKCFGHLMQWRKRYRAAMRDDWRDFMYVLSRRVRGLY